MLSILKKMLKFIFHYTHAWLCSNGAYVSINIFPLLNLQRNYIPLKVNEDDTCEEVGMMHNDYTDHIIYLIFK